MSKRISWLAFWVFVAIALGGLGGCQVDLGGNISMKGMYPTTAKTTAPDGTVTKQSTDPRQAMYNGSGYTERHGFGGETTEPDRKSGFKTLAKSEETEGGVR